MGRDIHEYRALTDRYDQIRVDMVRLALIIFFLLSVFISPAFAENDRFFTAGTVRARALAMVSAYHSLEDDFSAGLYNPGAFKLNATKNERRLRLFFNPAASFIALYDFSRYDIDFDEDKDLTVAEALLSASLFLKGFAYTTPVLDIGLSLGEEIVECGRPENESGRAFSVRGLTSCSFHSAFLNVKIAPTVSLGITGTLYNSRLDGDNCLQGGYTFGVLLTPNPKMNVGIVYNKIPDDFSDARMELECIENGSATSGISYHPDKKTVVSIDLRTVNKDNQPTSREIHAGIERCIADRIALRAGYYRKKATKDDVFSFGIGVLPVWERISKYANSTRNDIISYSLIMDKSSFERRWHVLSLLLRF